VAATGINKSIKILLQTQAHAPSRVEMLRNILIKARLACVAVQRIHIKLKQHGSRFHA
jgi:hypothetical protein